MKNELPFISLVIPTYNRKNKLSRLLESIYDNDYPLALMEIIVVDNNSSDDSLGMLKTVFPGVKVFESSNNLYSGGAREAGQKISNGKYIFFIDDDNVLSSNCISQLVEVMEKDIQIGVAAPLMLFYDRKDEVWCAGGILRSWGGIDMTLYKTNISEINFSNNIFSADFFPNAFMVRGEIFKKGVSFDNKNFPHNWNETDLCLKIRAVGYKLCTVIKSTTWHDLGYDSKITRMSNFNAYDQARSRIVFRRIHEKNILKKGYFLFFYFPLTTVFYLLYFLFQKNRMQLIFSHFKGILDGLKTEIINENKFYKK
jgi:GT2 family glycosyltransferase